MAAVLETLEHYANGERTRRLNVLSALWQPAGRNFRLPAQGNEPSFFQTWRNLSCLY